MQDEIVIYDDRPVPKSTFRTFVHGFGGVRKLATSWLDYKSLIASGIWFSKIEEVPKKEVKIVKVDKVVPSEPIFKGLKQMFKSSKPESNSKGDDS